MIVHFGSGTDFIIENGLKKLWYRDPVLYISSIIKYGWHELVKCEIYLLFMVKIK